MNTCLGEECTATDSMFQYLQVDHHVVRVNHLLHNLHGASGTCHVLICTIGEQKVNVYVYGCTNDQTIL